MEKVYKAINQQKENVKIQNSPAPMLQHSLESEDRKAIEEQIRNIESEDFTKAAHGKHFIENEKQVYMGQKHKSITDHNYIMVNKMNRICAPTQVDKMVSVILWTKDDRFDKNPTWEKIFGGVVYNLHKLDSQFSHDNEMVEDTMQGTEEILKQNKPIEHDRLTTGGVMAKDVGHHNNRGVTREVMLKVPDIKSQNPRPATLENKTRIAQLRSRMKASNPSMSCSLDIICFLLDF
ncbi:hypothetical protein H0H81_005539 [Sphagnurus paluster]|uniref:Uncharacterized protein n=1 Tax=Sphagnurus paluster TaxID=117069 RepID=A0A9P7GGH3_9AGAR|nr:hypothetical protein H0H81_005539 [Sphagnurus paluster]